MVGRRCRRKPVGGWFFARMLEKNCLQDADRARGRFRTFLLASVGHFLSNEHKAEHALKRGGGAIHLTMETDDEERRFHRLRKRYADTLREVIADTVDDPAAVEDE